MCLSQNRSCLINEAADGRKQAYFGKNLRAPLRPWSAAEKAAEFDPEIALAAVSTPEIAINPVALAQILRECIAAHPLIEVRCGRTVLGAEMERDRICVLSDGRDGHSRDSFDHVVNALWDGRLKLNEALGFRANRPWLHRLKYGVSFRLPPGVRPPPSATFVLGPFGEVVTYGDGIIYLTWYPECLQAISTDVTPPDWDTYPPEPLRSRIITGTLRALSAIVPSLGDLDAESLPEASVKGGAIVAWGKTDIYDPASELHRRFEIGVTSEGRFHSVDPGKLTMAPYFAEICAERISSRWLTCTEGDAIWRHRASLWDCQSTRAPISSPRLLIACNDRRSAISKPSSLLTVTMRKRLTLAAPFWPIHDSAWSCILSDWTGSVISTGFCNRI